ncbi:UNVERIFIED_CONTAM: hypothetical protein Slati_1442900 [Sesamum latifolium]|uniref:Uncharacterized protein n=1 Tax=Sesamum latifolium TaxID=2727402 RepID=A0AAW2X5Z5_9LAMI
MVAYSTERTTSIWNTTSFVETLGTSRPQSETPAARSPRMPSLGTCPAYSPFAEVVCFETAEHMTWHATLQTEEGSMCHPSDAEA